MYELGYADGCDGFGLDPRYSWDRDYVAGHDVGRLDFEETTGN